MRPVSPRGLRRGIVTVALSVTIGAASCSEIGRFSTDPGESYCGTVVGASFVRATVPTGAKMRLELDADALQTFPGRIWTSQLTPPIGTASVGEQLGGERLAAIPQLAHDPLSTLSFGEGRVKNALAVAQLTSGSQLLVVLSLLQSGDVEVRLIRGTSSDAFPASSTGLPQIFGVFRLSKEKGDCGLR